MISRTRRPNFSEDLPEWGAFTCLDGYAWHPNRDKRHCHKGLFAADMKLVASFYQGEAIERMLALRTLLLEGPSQGYVLTRLFPSCSTCEQTKAAQKQTVIWRAWWRRAAMAIHEGAIPLLREAKPGIEALRAVAIPEHLRLRHPGRGSKRYAQVDGIPVLDPRWDRRHPPEDESTRLAQIAWAAQFTAPEEEAS